MFCVLINANVIIILVEWDTSQRCLQNDTTVTQESQKFTKEQVRFSTSSLLRM